MGKSRGLERSFYMRSCQVEGVGGKIGPDLTETNDRQYPLTPASFSEGYIRSKGGGHGQG